MCGIPERFICVNLGFVIKQASKSKLDVVNTRGKPKYAHAPSTLQSFESYISHFGLKAMNLDVQWIVGHEFESAVDRRI